MLGLSAFFGENIPRSSAFKNSFKYASAWVKTCSVKKSTYWPILVMTKQRGKKLSTPCSEKCLMLMSASPVSGDASQLA